MALRMAIKLLVKGPYACFTRPEFKAERVSYDVMTPSAAKGILDAIYRRKVFKWVVKRIHVLNPINYMNIKRNEVKSVISHKVIAKCVNAGKPIYHAATEDRVQRNSMILTNVAYVIEACLELTPEGIEKGEKVQKHSDIFIRRARKGQCYQHPVLGCREFAVTSFEPVEEAPRSCHKGVTELGWMLYGIDHDGDKSMLVFPAKMVNGVIEIPPRDEAVKAAAGGGEA